MRAVVAAAALVVAVGTVPVPGQQRHENGVAESGYLNWSSAQAEQIGRRFRVNGRVGSAFGMRLLHTERSHNYKLRATWMTPEVVRATARLAQIADGLSNARTEALVNEAETVAGTVIMVEIDPREGSGVIPLDWTAHLGPAGARPGEPTVTRGENLPSMREVRALSGVFRRDYDYEVFWVGFPLKNDSGGPLLPHGSQEAELIVRIYNKEGRVKWPVPESIGAASQKRGR